MATALLGGSLVALYAGAAPFVAPALRRVCLPFVPATAAQVENVLKVLESRTGTLVDLGSGDGRIVSTRSCTDGPAPGAGTFTRNLHRAGPFPVMLCSTFLIF